MSKQAITEEMHLEKEWFKQAGKISTVEELTAFVNHVMNDYEHDYGTACHAVAACALAGAWYGCHVEDLTAFQASFVMWGFIRGWMKENNKCGLRLVDFDDMLYPQYEYKFSKTISTGTWNALQNEAKRKLEEDGNAFHWVLAHWKKIAEGEVPFGYRVKDL